MYSHAHWHRLVTGRLFTCVRKAKEGRKEKTGFGFLSTYYPSSEKDPLVVLVSK